MLDTQKQKPSKLIVKSIYKENTWVRTKKPKPEYLGKSPSFLTESR